MAKRDPPDDETQATLSRVAEVSRLSFGPTRTPLRSTVKQAIEGGWKAPTNKNGHHPKGLFEAEPNDPAAVVDAIKQHSESGIFFEMNETERMAMFRRAFRRQTDSLQDWTHYRIRAAWRIVREVATIAGMVADDEKLQDIVATNPDPWLVGGACPSPDPQDKHVLQMWSAVEYMTGLDGLPLLPPQVPGKFRDDGGIVSEYNPTRFDHDPRLHKYLDLITFIALTLRIEEGSVTDPEQGIKGMEGLEDPFIARLAWPSRLQICAWEDHVVCEALDALVDKGNQSARKKLMSEYGLQEHEVRRVIRMALSEAGQRVANGSVEEERGLMLLKLEKIETLAIEQGELRTALGASKQASIVLGLGKVDPADILKEFADIVRDRGRRRQPAALPAPRETKALTLDAVGVKVK